MIFKSLSLALNKVGNIAKDIAVKGKNQILDPLKLFTDNCSILNRSFLVKLKEKENELHERYAELYKAK